MSDIEQLKDKEIVTIKFTGKGILKPIEKMVKRKMRKTRQAKGNVFAKSFKMDYTVRCYNNFTGFPYNLNGCYGYCDRKEMIQYIESHLS